MRQAASGSSSRDDSGDAAAEAVAQARSELSSRPDIGLLFASARHDLARALAVAREAFPDTAWMGCHTAGEFTERELLRGGLVVLLVSCPDWLIETRFAPDVAQIEESARQLTHDFENLQSEARRRGLGLSSTLLLLDGLAGTGEQLIREMLRHTRMFQTIVGGAAGDSGGFERAWVGSADQTGSRGAAALQVFHGHPWGVGLGHGLQPSSGAMKVTRACGNVVYEIDGEPAFLAYSRHAAGMGVELKPENIGFLIENELGVMLLNRLHHARAPVRVGTQGELFLVGQIPEGTQVCILNGQPAAMVAACRQAAQDAKDSLRGQRASAVVVFDCVCRGTILGAQFEQELEAVRTVFPETPFVGFLTYGEIARTGGQLDGWHNATCVVLALPA